MNIPEVIKAVIFDPQIGAFVGFCSIFVSAAVLHTVIKKLSSESNYVSDILSVSVNKKLCFIVCSILYVSIKIFGIFSAYSLITNLLEHLTETFMLYIIIIK